MSENVWLCLIARISSEGIVGMVTMWLQKQEIACHMSCDSNLEVVLLLFWLISDAAAICVSLRIYVRDSFLQFVHHFFSHLQFDTNGDGQISTAELREAMKKLLGQQVWSCWERLSFQSCCLFESWLFSLLVCCAWVLCHKHSYLSHKTDFFRLDTEIWKTSYETSTWTEMGM